jgi:acyl-CoA thioesterase-1
VTELRICFVGDSITAGRLDAEMLGWPGRLARREVAAGHNVTPYNLGIRGDTSRDVLVRWLAECTARLADEPATGALVFAFGINDAVEKEGHGVQVSLGESLANARAILTAAATWLPTLWIGPTPCDEQYNPFLDRDGIAWDIPNARLAEYDAAYESLAAEIGVPYLHMLAPLAQNPHWIASLAAGDGVHPAAVGFDVMAELIAEWPAWRRWFA